MKAGNPIELKCLQSVIKCNHKSHFVNLGISPRTFVTVVKSFIPAMLLKELELLLLLTCMYSQIQN